MNWRTRLGCAALLAVLALGVVLSPRRSASLDGGMRARGVDGIRLASPAPTPRHSVLWLLAIGVGRYADPALNLHFPVSDALALAETLAQQKSTGAFADVETLLLRDEEVTGETILDGIRRFLGQAGPDDVAVVFFAGHGVKDRSGTYTLLGSPATGADPGRQGLRLSDFDDALAGIRRKTGRVVVILDACHAGAAGLQSPAGGPADDLAARVSLEEGSYVLAATKPGEESFELAALGHGAFTYALIEGLRGGADPDRDGLISISDLVAYVARRVPQLTDGRQHPYHRIEGTDLVLAGATATPPPAASAGAEPAPTAKPAANEIGVMEFRNVRQDPEQAWIGKALRAAFNTELSKVRAFRVHAPELVDAQRTEGRDDLEAARRLGIGTIVTGDFAVVGNTIRIDARIVDAVAGTNRTSDSAQGDMAEFFALEKDLILRLLQRTPVTVSAAEGEAIKQPTNTNVDAYRLLLEAEGVATAAEKPARTPGKVRPRSAPRRPRSQLDGGGHGLASRLLERLVGPASAAESDAPDTAAIKQFLDEYRRTYEKKDLDRLAGLYESFPPAQREALRAYLGNADHLGVELSDVEVERRGEQIIVSYTRHDSFTDHQSGEQVRLEVRLTKVLVRDGDRWRFANVR